MAFQRHQNRGLRKLCDCPRRTWAKCSHSWHFNFKPKGGPSYRFSVDSEAGKHIESKTDAEARADNWRTAIRTGTFRRRADLAAVEATPTPETLLLQTFIDTYLQRSARPVSTNDRGCLRKFAAFRVDEHPLGDTPLSMLTEDTIEMFFASLAAAAASTRNKYVQAVKAMLRWATKKGYLLRNPLADSDTIKRGPHAKRARRLTPDTLNEKGQIAREGEERRLLAVAGPHLQRLIIAALEACCRRGELLALQWRDVDLAKRELVVRAEDEGARKTGQSRLLPISTKLAGVLEMARTAIVTFIERGAKLSEDERAALLARCYVFGDEAGFQAKSVKRAWETAVLKAHGHTPQWTTGNKLAAASRAALDAIDLHFHDLRHEGASRLLEAGWPLHHVQHMLGHANVSQTSTYLNATKIGLQDSMRRLDDARCNPVASSQKTDHALPRNDESQETAKSLVN